MNSRTVRKIAFAANVIGVAGISVLVGVEARSVRTAAFATVPSGLYLVVLSRRVGWKER